MTLLNSFHNTTARTRKPYEDVARIRYILGMGDAEARRRLPAAEYAWALSVRRRLCGVDGCTCAQTPLGERW